MCVCVCVCGGRGGGGDKKGVKYVYTSKSRHLQIPCTLTIKMRYYKLQNGEGNELLTILNFIDGTVIQIHHKHCSGLC